MALKALPIAARSTKTIDVPVVGWIADYRAETGLIVDFGGNPGPPLPARGITKLTAGQAQEAAIQRAPVVLIFEDGDPTRPIAIGLVQETANLEASPLGGKPAEAVVDGRRVILSGEDEVQLRCGKASITLRRNGAVIIKGAHVVSDSSGVNRLRGGSVQLN